MAQEHLWPSGSGPTGCQGQRVGAAVWFWMRISLDPHKPNPPSLTDLRPSFSVLRWKNVSFVAPFWEVASFKRNEPPPFKRMFVSSAATGGGECGWRSHTTGCLWSLRWASPNDGQTIWSVPPAKQGMQCQKVFLGKLFRVDIKGVKVFCLLLVASMKPLLYPFSLGQ